MLIARQHNLSVTPLPPAAAAAALSGLILGCFASVNFVIAFLFKDFQIIFRHLTRNQMYTSLEFEIILGLVNSVN